MKKLTLILQSIFFFAVLLFVAPTSSHAATIDACLPTPPPPACNATCTPGGPSCPQDCPNCTSGTAGYTCKSAPACNSACTTPADCTGAKDSCTACTGGKCQKPPACNVTCSTPADCTGAKDGCTECVAGATGAKTCQKPPPACGASCDSKDPNACAGAKDGCTACVNSKCSLPPTPTPTPDPFNEDMCKCDGLETAAAIEPDKPITITAYGKVLAADDKYAKISTVQFALLKGTGASTKVDKILESDKITAEKVDGPAGIVRYKASWTFDIPQPVEKGVEYRIGTTTKCAKNTAFRPLTRSVAAAQDENKGFFASLGNFFSSLFGFDNGTTGDSNNSSQPSPTQTQEQLKLGTFEPLKSKVLENNNCNLLRFEFEPL